MLGPWGIFQCFPSCISREWNRTTTTVTQTRAHMRYQCCRWRLNALHRILCLSQTCFLPGLSLPLGVHAELLQFFSHGSLLLLLVFVLFCPPSAPLILFPVGDLRMSFLFKSAQKRTKSPCHGLLVAMLSEHCSRGGS